MLIDQIRDAKLKFANFFGKNPQHIYLTDDLYDHLENLAGEILWMISIDDDSADYVEDMKLHHLEDSENKDSNFPMENRNCLLSYEMTGYEIFRSYHLKINH